MDMNAVMRTVKEHVWGPVGSVFFHILLVVILLKFATSSTVTDAPDVLVTQMEAVETKLDDVNKALEEVTKIEETEVVDTVTPPDVDISQPVEVPSDGAAGTGGAGSGAGGGFGSGVGEGTFDGFAVASDQAAPLTMKGLYAGRSAGGRAKGLGANGGDVRTEMAVIKALEWLKKHQAANGSWGAQNPVAITGLGILTFLAHGETTASTNYGATVERAIKYLTSQQNESGAFGGLNPGACGEGGDATSYTHGIATYALSEAYGITRIPSLKPAMDKAVDIIVRFQQAGGGWDYRFCKGPRVDTSVAGWQIQALKAAYIAGSETPGIKEALSKAANYLKGMQNPETGAFGYSTPGQGSPAITGVGVLCLQMIGHAEDKEVDKGLQYMRDWDLRWDKPLSPSSAMYGWYYITQAKFHKGGGDWTSWNQHLKKELPANQKEDGHWDFPGEEHGKACGPAYSTTLAALSLQVYYRFLPTYKPITIEKPAEEKSEDVKIEII